MTRYRALRTSRFAEGEGRGRSASALRVTTCACLAGLVVGCAPTVKVQTPDEPIVINLNVKIEHEIRVKVDDELEDLFAENGDLFGEAE
jgi:hypothetical protein